jgi:DNA helicase-2/ATP-dependent DNA helicase PcrA
MDDRMSERCRYSDFAVLYRTNAQSRVIEEALRKKNIPYRVYGGQSFYQRKEVKDLIAYCRVVVNPHDEEALKRIINFPVRGIGETTVRKLLAAASIHQVSVWQTLCDPVALSVQVNAGTMKKLTDFQTMIDGLVRDNTLLSAEETVEQIVKRSGMASMLYQDRTIEGISRQENVQEVMKAVAEFCAIKREEGAEQVSLSDFLIEVALITDQDEDSSENPNRVTLMTAHSAKGLEFDHVFIAGLEENLFPTARAMGNPNAVEEERRLLYVAITRAKRRCTITYSKSRFLHGQYTSCKPSPFLMDIDPQYLNPLEDLQAITRFSAAPGSSPDERTIPPSPRMTKILSSDSTPKEKVTSLDGFHVGDTVYHNRFGKGKVLSLEGSGGDAKAQIEFENSGLKTLILKYAALNILNR